jgi:TRAP-type C4-dicarboxylate transport system permease large subunit
MLLKERYPELFSLGLLTTCGSLGLLFPPSLPIILYGLVAGAPVDLLFLAGVVPGLVLLLLLALYSVYQAYRHGVPRQRSAWSAVWEALWATKWELALPVLVLIGIYGGLVTINEAAVVTAAYSLVVTVGIHRDLHLWGMLSYRPFGVKVSLEVIHAHDVSADSSASPGLPARGFSRPTRASAISDDGPDRYAPAYPEPAPY